MITLITGCRSGFGLLSAVSAARAGHTVYAGLRDPETADDLMAAADGLPVHPLALDVTEPEQCQAAVDRVLSEHGRIDGLVNNAGVALGGFLEQLERDELEHLYAVNVLGVWELTCAVLPTMRAQRSGSIVNIGSMAGTLALPGLGAYASSKFALEGMTESWRQELAPWGIGVSLVKPGPYKTDILNRNARVGRRVRDADSPWAPMVRRLDEVFEQNAEQRSGDPQDVADTVVRLLGSARPPMRVAMGPGARARVWAKAVAPFGLIEGAIGRVLKLPKP